MSFTDKVGIGTVQFGMDYGISNREGKTPFTEVDAILNYAREVGIRYIDTARGYGDAESVLGTCGIDDDFKVISKFMPSEIAGSIRQQFQDSCGKLKVDSLYGYLSHRPVELLTSDEDWNDLQKLKTGGKIQKIGFSINSPRELEALLTERFIPDLIQVPFNYFDNRFVPLMIELKNQGCEIHTRSAFLQGLFFANMDSLSVFFNPIKSYVKKIQLENKGMLPGALLKYVISKDFVDKVVIGVQTKDQLVQNLQDILTAPSLNPFLDKIPEEILTPFAWPKK